MEKFNVQPGTKVAPDRFHITVMEEGPYLVYGQPPLKQQFMLPNREGEIWYYKAGKEYATQDEPTALCRCGASKTKPYCDGSHVHTDWDPSLTASEEPLLDEAESFGGPEVALTDNREYCAFARFCDAKGQVWNLVEEEGERARDLTIREADRRPAGTVAFRRGSTPAIRTNRISNLRSACWKIRSAGAAARCGCAAAFRFNAKTGLSTRSATG